jgi:asparaginyl-tRNA synthetase
VRTRRDNKDLAFVEINDGSCLANLQLVIAGDLLSSDAFKAVATGAAVRAVGALEPSEGQGQKWDFRVREIEVVAPSGPDFPLQKKRHSDEYLREIAHLRPRTNKFGAMFRLRSECAFALHSFMRERLFFQVHTPIVTGNDCEGAGELFRVSAAESPAGAGAEGTSPSPGALGPYDAFFGKEATLAVSGQLEAELLAMGLGRVYSFGPAFRAENSNTPRHMAEFWMLEPEAAFFDLADDMSLAEEMVQDVLGFLLENRLRDLELFDRFVSKGLIESLGAIKSRKFARISYKEAIKALSEAKGVKFAFPVHYGADLKTEHERFLSESYARGPVFVHDYPKELKPFYMRLNDDGETVAAMDLLAPRIGELIGGSQREERLDALEARLKELGLRAENYWWYLDSRRWGGAPHAGFGLGFERLLMLISGLGNIRDVIPFPRTPGNLEF